MLVVEEVALPSKTMYECPTLWKETLTGRPACPTSAGPKWFRSGATSGAHPDPVRLEHPCKLSIAHHPTYCSCIIHLCASASSRRTSPQSDKMEPTPNEATPAKVDEEQARRAKRVALKELNISQTGQGILHISQSRRIY